MVHFRGGVRRISSTAALAGWILLPSMRLRQELDNREGIASMRGLPATDVPHRRDDLRGYEEAVADVVSGDLVCNQPETRWQCAWASTSAGIGQLPDSVDVVA